MKKILILIFVLSFPGCLEKEDFVEIYIPQELKDYMYFKTGTWWVYEEATSKDRDSVVVYYNRDSIITLKDYSGVPDGTYEIFDCNTHSSYDDYKYYYSCNTTWTNKGRTPVFRDKSKPGDYVGATVIMTNSNKIGNKYYPYTEVYGVVTLMGAYDSLETNGLIYYDVKKYNDSKNNTENYDSTNFFLAKNMGIIRKELIKTNKVWNLVNYNIIK